MARIRWRGQLKGVEEINRSQQRGGHISMHYFRGDGDRISGVAKPQVTSLAIGDTLSRSR
jgi:hypothetical protein